MFALEKPRALSFSLVFCACLLSLIHPSFASAEVQGATRAVIAGETPTVAKNAPGPLVAQADGDDAYDPFSDYSEYEESSDEEEDLNFFRNGRLFTLGFLGGIRGFTGTLGSIYQIAPSFGVYMTYFFDLRFALQFGYMTSQHTLAIPARPSYGSEAINGNMTVQDIEFLLKYYFNTQNVTRGLASLNPYIIFGGSQLYRTVVVSGQANYAKDSAFGADFGGGIEIPMLRNKMYFGIQLMYQYVTFADANSVINDANGTPTGLVGSGQTYQVTGILGINF